MQFISPLTHKANRWLVTSALVLGIAAPAATEIHSPWDGVVLYYAQTRDPGQFDSLFLKEFNMACPAFAKAATTCQEAEDVLERTHAPRPCVPIGKEYELIDWNWRDACLVSTNDVAELSQAKISNLAPGPVENYLFAGIDDPANLGSLAARINSLMTGNDLSIVPCFTNIHVPPAPDSPPSVSRCFHNRSLLAAAKIGIPPPGELRRLPGQKSWMLFNSNVPTNQWMFLNPLRPEYSMAGDLDAIEARQRDYFSFERVQDASAAVISPGALFRDGLILQKDQVTQLWGFGGDQVQVTVSGEHGFSTNLPAQAESMNRWSCGLDGPSLASQTNLELEITGRNNLQPANITQVALGDVYLFVGDPDIAGDLETNTSAKIRFFNLGARWATNPVVNPAGEPGSWSAAPQPVPGMALAIARSLGSNSPCPVGIVLVSMGVCDLKSWVPPDPSELAKAAWEDAPTILTNDPDLQPDNINSNGIFNGMLAPLCGPNGKWAVKAVLFSYGAWFATQQTNSLDQESFRQDLKTLITSWRKVLLPEETPFFILKTHALGALDPASAVGRSWQAVRDVETIMTNLPNVHVVPAEDFPCDDLRFGTNDRAKFAASVAAEMEVPRLK